jgi:pimeloyl-ACP methyl ester carboxylesterase
MRKHDVDNSNGMHLVHDGSRQAAPLLLIHGSGASGAFWSPVVAALAVHHHVIRVDLPGCGQSPDARERGEGVAGSKSPQDGPGCRALSAVAASPTAADESCPFARNPQIPSGQH